MKKIIITLISVMLCIHGYSQSKIYVIDNGKHLYTVDLTNCSNQLVGTTSNEFLDIAINPLTNIMYGVTDRGNLCSIDITNANSTFIGFAGYFNALTFNSNGVLYGAGNWISTIDLTTGQASIIGSCAAGTSSGGDLAFFNNRLYLTTGGSTLEYIDLANLSNSFVLDSISVYKAYGYGLTSTVDGCKTRLYSFSGSNVYKINPGNISHPELICNLPGIYNVFGAASTSEGIESKVVGLGPDLFKCDNSPVILDATLTNASYVWQDNSSNPTFTAFQPGKYWVTTNVSGCISSDTVLIKPVSIPAINFGPDRVLCQGKTVLLDATLNGATYSWSDYSAMPSLTVNGAGIYSVTRFLYNCINRDTIGFRLSGVPRSFYLGNDTLLCKNEKLALHIPDTIRIYPEPLTVAFYWQDHSTNNTFQVSQAGKYWLTITDTNCTISDTILVSYKNPPPVYLGNDTAMCEGKMLMAESHIDPGMVSYLWQDNSIDSTFLIKASGKYWVTVKDYYCSNSDTILVSYFPLPSVNLGNDQYYCREKIITLSNIFNNADYLWQDNSINPSYLVNGPDTYWLKVTVNGCSNADTIIIKTLPFLDLGTDTTLCYGDQLVLNTGGKYTSYLWQDKSVKYDYTVHEEGSYWVKVTLDGCAIFDTVNVMYKDCKVVLIMPNLVTPNADKANDLFVPITIEGVASVQLIIYNRWGEQIFTSDNQQIEWDSADVVDGIYYWMIHYTDLKGKEFSQKGWVQVAR